MYKIIYLIHYLTKGNHCIKSWKHNKILDYVTTSSPSNHSSELLLFYTRYILIHLFQSQQNSWKVRRWRSRCWFPTVRRCAQSGQWGGMRCGSRIGVVSLVHLCRKKQHFFLKPLTTLSNVFINNDILKKIQCPPLAWTYFIWHKAALRSWKQGNQWYPVISVVSVYLNAPNLPVFLVELWYSAHAPNH